MIHNGVNGTGVPLFKYVRPTFDGYGFDEQPNKWVKVVIDKLVKQLKKGFHDTKEPANAVELAKYKAERARLEDESQNGFNEAQDRQERIGQALEDIRVRHLLVREEIIDLKEQLEAVRDALARLPTKGASADEIKRQLVAEQKVLEQKKARFDEASASYEEAFAREQALIRQIEALENAETGQEVEGGGPSIDELKRQLKVVQLEVGKKKSAFANAQTAYDKALEKKEALENALTKLTEEDELKNRLKAKHGELDSIELERVEAKGESQAAATYYEHTLDRIRFDLDEVNRKIQEAESNKAAADTYRERFDLATLMEDIDDRGKTSFQQKIGSDPKLHGLYVVVEDRVEKMRLDFNASLFFKQEDLLRFAFLRAYYFDGMRDAEAITDRVTDAEEGGVKHIYDYVVEQAVELELKNRKLK